jgi:integrase
MNFLKAALDLAAEEFGIRPPAMPKIDRVRGKAKKAILTPEQIATLIAAAKVAPERGVYVATPFLTGLRIGEMLGLQWPDIDFDRNEIDVRRVQENNGTTFDAPKTAAGFRTIPMGPTLRDMFLKWRDRCPRLDDKFNSRAVESGEFTEGKGADLFRVFPSRGKRQPWPKPRQAGGLSRAGLEAVHQALGAAGSDAAQRAAQLHLDAAGGRDRGGDGGEAGRACQPGDDCRNLFARD